MSKLINLPHDFADLWVCEFETVVHPLFLSVGTADGKHKDTEIYTTDLRTMENTGCCFVIKLICIIYPSLIVYFVNKLSV